VNVEYEECVCIGMINERRYGAGWESPIQQWFCLTSEYIFMGFGGLWKSATLLSVDVYIDAVIFRPSMVQLCCRWAPVATLSCPWL
jgi:hypothetical protein